MGIDLKDRCDRSTVEKMVQILREDSDQREQIFKHKATLLRCSTWHSYCATLASTSPFSTPNTSIVASPNAVPCLPASQPFVLSQSLTTPTGSSTHRSPYNRHYLVTQTRNKAASAWPPDLLSQKRRRVV
ncbi:hypothetical protein TB1_032136 [Malus domestica]